MSKLKSKLEQLVRLIYVGTITRLNNSILLVEYPKSGGTWLGQLVSEYCLVKFPRNKIPTLETSLYHGHYLPKKRLLKNDHIIYLVRDGRDVMISLYYHRLIFNDKNKMFDKKEVDYHREQLNFDDLHDVKSNLGDFIDFSFTHKPSKLHHFTFMGNWFDYNSAWLNAMESQSNIYMVKYEDLLKDTHKTMLTLLESMGETNIDNERLKAIIAKYSFENQTKRKKGQLDTKSFLRKGISGDWKNYFSEEHKQKFKAYTANLLVRLGYEDDANW